VRVIRTHTATVLAILPGSNTLKWIDAVAMVTLTILLGGKALTFMR
jgi:hypothetical protein